MKKMWLLIALILAAGFLLSCESAFDEDDINGMTDSAYDWPVATPEDQGGDSARLEAAVNRAENYGYYYSLVVLRNGYLVKEAYYGGLDANDMHLTNSVTKSVTGALVGIAIAQGFIDGLDQKVMPFFPQYNTSSLDPRKSQISIRQLLTMQSGFDEEANLLSLESAPDMVEAILRSELRFDPGTQFLYSTHGSHLLSAVLTRATGMSTLQFARAYLFRPLGIGSVSWACDQNGINLGGVGLSLAPRDMARLGYCYLNRGLVDEQQIVPADYVVDAIRNHRSQTEPWKSMSDVGYGYQWWTGRFGELAVHFASGFGGQWILNVPDLNLVVAATMNAESERGWAQMESFIDLVNDEILPAFQ